MGKLGHYTNKKKLILMRKSEKLREMSYEEVLKESSGMIEMMVKKYHWCTNLDIMIEDDDLRNSINFGIFKAFNEYNHDYYGNGYFIYFLKFAEGYAKNALRGFLQRAKAQRRTPQNVMTYYDGYEDPDEKFSGDLVVENDSKLDILDYIEKELPPKRIELYLEMCEEVMIYGEIDVKNIMKKFNMPRQTVQYQWNKLVYHIKKKNNKTHIFF